MMTFHTLPPTMTNIDVAMDYVEAHGGRNAVLWSGPDGTIRGRFEANASPAAICTKNQELVQIEYVYVLEQRRPRRPTQRLGTIG